MPFDNCKINSEVCRIHVRLDKLIIGDAVNHYLFNRACILPLILGNVFLSSFVSAVT
jgi:hypothetical protein